MRESLFVKQNADRWKKLEAVLQQKSKASPDEQADLFVQITDDLGYAKTFYPESKLVGYLNELASESHRGIYRNKREESNRIWRFWALELPLQFYRSHRQLFYSFLIFGLAVFIGALSAARDPSFVRLILGDSYVNMTLENINNNDPMAVYKDMHQVDMFLAITLNNILVSFKAFAYGVFCSIGTVYVLVQNGVMLGAFQYFFYEQGLFLTSALTIWIHGTLEISAIIIAGCAGLVMGNSIVFPETYSRLESFRRGARQGLIIIVGLVPIFITAGFLESFITRQTDMPTWQKVSIIGASALFIIWYFIIYPIVLNQQEQIKKDTLNAIPS